MNQFFSYKLCVTEKRTYVNKLKFPNGFVVNLYPLINYLAQNASVGNIEYDSDKPNSCNICQISFRKKMKHRAHITVFQDGKKYLGCCACDAKFSWGNFRHLKSHISAVHEGKSYRCNFCGDCFTEKEGLEEHEASVHGGKKLTFKCALCNDRFQLKTSLKTHVETVHGDILSLSQKPVYDREDPNSCNFCQITFQQKSYYRAHITTIKAGKKLLKCCACDKKLSYDVRILQKHIAFVHEGKQIITIKSLNKPNKYLKLVLKRGAILLTVISSQKEKKIVSLLIT